MNIINIIQLNKLLSKKFTHEQLINIIGICYDKDNNFNKHVVKFYNDVLEFDDNDTNDLIYDICNGYNDAFIRFAEDINYYCNI